jgi:hypothetical protein
MASVFSGFYTESMTWAMDKPWLADLLFEADNKAGK